MRHRTAQLWIGIFLAVASLPACAQEEAARLDSTAASAPAVSATPGAASTDSMLSHRYALARESRFEVHTGRGGALGGFAHNHLIRARSFSGYMTYDENDPGSSSFEIRVPVEGLEVLTAAKPADKAKIREAMLGKVLKADKFPEITFVSRHSERIDNGLRIEGDLTLVGQTRPVQVDVALEQKENQLAVRGKFTIRQTAFGIKPYSAALGTIKVADTVSFDFEAIGNR